MGNKFGNKNKKIQNNILNCDLKNYRCAKCDEIPLIKFKDIEFDLICQTHKILNIPIEKFNEFLIFDFKCSLCGRIQIKNNRDFIYCFDCNKTYCSECKINHGKSFNNTHFETETNLKYSICKKHHKQNNRYCYICKINLCEKCEIHDKHYNEMLNDIIPDSNIINEKNNDIIKLKDSILKSEKDKKFISIKNNKEFLQSLKICIDIKEQMLNCTYKNIKHNYFFLDNIINISIDNWKNIKLRINQKTEKNKCLFVNCSFNDNNNISEEEHLNINNKEIIKSEKNISLSSIWCMSQLNRIKYIDKGENKTLDLIAVGGSYNDKILLINSKNLKIYQKLNEHQGSVYSFAQFDNEFKYLFSSANDGTVNIYKLNEQNNFYLIQKLQKEESKRGGEINKVIALSNKLLVTGDHRSITIWKKKGLENIKNTINDENKIEYEDYYEHIINKDTCHLLEVNPKVFVATQYSGNRFQIYKNDSINFPKIGELIGINTHGSSANGLSKISDKLICSGGDSYINIVCIEPIQLLQKIKVGDYSILFTCVAKNGFLYCGGGKHQIFQYKIKTDEENNYIELIKLGKISSIKSRGSYYSSTKAIVPFEDGRIFLNFQNENFDEFHLIY